MKFGFQLGSNLPDVIWLIISILSSVRIQKLGSPLSNITRSVRHDHNRPHNSITVPDVVASSSSNKLSLYGVE